MTMDQNGQPGGTPPGAAPQNQQPQGGTNQHQLPAPGAPPRPRVGDLGEEALSARLARAKEAAVREYREKIKAATGGIDDPDALASKWKEHQGLSAKEEERRRAEMSEVERLKADLVRHQQEAEQYKSQLQQMQQERESERYNQQVVQTAGQYLTPAGVKVARIEFAEHCNTLKKQQPDQLKRYEKNPKLVDLWFRNWSKKNPDFSANKAAQQQTQPQGTPPAQEQRRAAPPQRQPITNGSAPRRQGMPGKVTPGQDPSRGLNGKTVRGGQQNSMSPAEIREYAKQHGINYPS